MGIEGVGTEARELKCNGGVALAWKTRDLVQQCDRGIDKCGEGDDGEAASRFRYVI